jgi:hypothetical protein
VWRTLGRLRLRFRKRLGETYPRLLLIARHLRVDWTPSPRREEWRDEESIRREKKRDFFLRRREGRAAKCETKKKKRSKEKNA